MSRCNGVTRVGKRCSVTSSSNWADDHSRLVAGPVIILDLETTGIDIVNDRIIDIAATHAHSDSHMKGECFSTTVCADAGIIRSRGKEAFKVHAITGNEIKQPWRERRTCT